MLNRKGSTVLHLRQHRTIASASLRRLFAPLLQFEKREIHTVFLRFPNFELGQKSCLRLLAELRGAALATCTPNSIAIPRQLLSGVGISRMKSTMYRPSPKISPLYEQSMGGHRSPVPFNREIPTPLRPLFVPERNRRSRLLARSSLRTGVGMTQYRNGPLSHGVRHDSSDIAQKGEPRGLRPAKFQFTCFPKYRPPGIAFPCSRRAVFL